MNYFVFDSDQVQRAVELLDSFDGNEDPEADHGNADNVLLSMVPSDVADAYRRLVNRARWWA